MQELVWRCSNQMSDSDITHVIQHMWNDRYRMHDLTVIIHSINQNDMLIYGKLDQIIMRWNWRTFRREPCMVVRTLNVGKGTWKHVHIWLTVNHLKSFRHIMIGELSGTDHLWLHRK